MTDVMPELKRCSYWFERYGFNTLCDQPVTDPSNDYCWNHQPQVNEADRMYRKIVDSKMPYRRES